MSAGYVRKLRPQEQEKKIGLLDANSALCWATRMHYLMLLINCLSAFFISLRMTVVLLPFAV
jgi:hypothetical protein